MDRREWLTEAAWLLFWGVLSSVWCVGAAWANGATWDEPFYTRAGLACWKRFEHKPLLSTGTMPLPVEVETLPLFVAQSLGADPAGDLPRWLPVGRSMTLLFWWLLLLAARGLARSVGGLAAGRLAVALVALEPQLLGHASLLTTDLAFTACLTAALWWFEAGRDATSRWRRWGLPALGVALTLLSKASGLVFLPVCLVALEAVRLTQLGWRGRWLRSLGDVTLIGALGAALTYACCWKAHAAVQFQLRHAAEGHGVVYLLGQTSPDGFWYYFPVALSMKLGLPVFVLLVVMFLARPRGLFNGPLVAAVALVTLSTTFKLQIGVRYVLPVAVLLTVGGAGAFGGWWRARRADRGWLPAAVAAALLLWAGFSAVSVWPRGIAYTNELWGGTPNGYRWLTDSNYDWGQGLPELAAWQADHADAPLNVWYFGNDPLLERLPMRRVHWTYVPDGDDLVQRNRGGYLAVSLSILYGGEGECPAARYLRTLQPAGRTSTFFIYDFREVR